MLPSVRTLWSYPALRGVPVLSVGIVFLTYLLLLSSIITNVSSSPLSPLSLSTTEGFISSPLPLNGTVLPVGDGSYEAYLVPPFPQNHAATIEQLPNGDLVIAWFSGLKEEAPNCSIAVSRLPYGSDQFTPSQVVSLRVNYSNQNPVLFYDTTTDILHLYHAQLYANTGEGKSTLMHLYSTDNGITWSEPVLFLAIDNGGVFDRNRIVIRTDGSLLFPLYFTTDGVPNSPFVLFSSVTNHSVWSAPHPVGPIGSTGNLVQPTVVRITPSTLKMFLRDRNAKNIYACTSTDEGVTWSIPTIAAAGNLPNNNAGIEAYQLLSGGTILLFNNESGTGTRTPMTVALSYDGGISWTYSRNLQVHDDNGTQAIEFSYPTVLQSTKDTLIHSAYTYDRMCIKYRRFTEEWVKQGQDRTVISHHRTTTVGESLPTVGVIGPDILAPLLTRKLNRGLAASISLGTMKNITVQPEDDEEVQEENEHSYSSTTTVNQPHTDTLITLDNGIVFLGIDTSRGASVGGFGPSGGPNYANIHDFGREIQVSYYTGPAPYNPPGCDQPPSYAGFPYNPIGAGDYYGNPARILSINVSSDNTSAIVTSIPAQWACNNTPAEGILVKTITLVGNVAEVSAVLTLNRPDRTIYPPFQQELPAVYVTGSLCSLWAYTGNNPYTNDTATQLVPPDPQNGITLRVPEQWLAYLLPDNSAGIGLWHPDSTVFAAMRYNSSFEGCVGGPYDDVTGYISARYAETLDWNIRYEYNYSLVWGSLTDIRSYATMKKNTGISNSGIRWNFSNDRQHFTTTNCNSSWPMIDNAITLTLPDNDPNFISGFAWWKAEDVPKIYVTCAYSTTQHDTTAQIFYLREDMNGFDGNHVVTFTIIADGTFHTYAVSMTSAYQYTGVMTQFRFDPVIAGMPGAYVNISSILSTPPP